MLSRIISKRYLVPDRSLETLANRVSSKLYPPGEQRDLLSGAMRRKLFFPAGNTLLAGIEPIRPNCVILPSVSERNLPNLIQRAEKLWNARIGIGFSFNECEKPLHILEALSEANSNIDLHHRPQRGNMATLSAMHNSIEEFVFSKTNRRSKDKLERKNGYLYNFNTSVVIRDQDIAEHPEHIRMVLEMISEAAWQGGDPGVVFLDRITSQLPYNYANAALELGNIETLVPCGEQAMHPNEVCTLGSINIASEEFWRKEKLGWVWNQELYRDTIKTAVRSLDAAHEAMDLLGDKELERTASLTRRIGLGLMGWSDAISRYCIGYSDQRELIYKIGTDLKTYSRSESIKIGKEKSVCKFTHPYEKSTIDAPRAHLTLTCAAPTGGISLLANNKGFSLDPLPEDLDRISSDQQLHLLKSWQPYFDNTISKTISVREDTRVDKVREIFLKALNSDVKTLTVYRSGSRALQPLQTSPIRCEGC